MKNLREKIIGVILSTGIIYLINKKKTLGLSYLERSYLFKDLNKKEDIKKNDT